MNHPRSWSTAVFYDWCMRKAGLRDEPAEQHRAHTLALVDESAEAFVRAERDRLLHARRRTAHVPHDTGFDETGEVKETPSVVIDAVACDTAQSIGAIEGSDCQPLAGESLIAEPVDLGEHMGDDSDPSGEVRRADWNTIPYGMTPDL